MDLSTTRQGYRLAHYAGTRQIKLRSQVESQHIMSAHMRVTYSMLLCAPNLTVTRFLAGDSSLFTEGKPNTTEGLSILILLKKDMRVAFFYY